MDYLKTFIILALLSANLMHCADDDPGLTEIEKLPPKTQTGEGTFGCLVNGKAWVINNSLKSVAIYQRDILQVGGDLHEPDRQQFLSLVIINLVLEEGKIYSLTDYPNSFCEFISVLPNECIYEYNHAFNGQLVFSKVDINNRIISGEFSFDMVKGECDTIKVTDGRFDLQLFL